MRRMNPTLLVGAVIVGCLVLVALLSQVWTPVPPTRIQILQKLKAPLDGSLLGTDHLGRDVLSMLMVGAWNSLTTSAIAVALGGFIGTVVGVGVAARRGWLEAVVMRINDVIFAIPPVLSAMMLGAFLGAGNFTAIIAIAIFLIPVFARITMGAALQIWARDYTKAARAAGKGWFLISVEHVLPNILNQIIVHGAIQLGLAMLTESALSFLGLGQPPPAPTWGRMLADAQTYMAAAPWLALAPGCAIALAVFGFNMLGDGLRDYFDPKERGH